MITTSQGPRNEFMSIVIQLGCKFHSFIGTLSRTLFQEHVLISYALSLLRRRLSIWILQEWNEPFLYSPPGFLMFWTNNAHGSVEPSVCTMTGGLPDPIPLSDTYLCVLQKIVSCHHQSQFWVAPGSIRLVLQKFWSLIRCRKSWVGS